MNTSKVYTDVGIMFQQFKILYFDVLHELHLHSSTFQTKRI